MDQNAAAMESAVKMIRQLRDQRSRLKADAERGDELTEALRALFWPSYDAVYLQKRGWTRSAGDGRIQWWKADTVLRDATAAVGAEVRELIGEQP